MVLIMPQYKRKGRRNRYRQDRSGGRGSQNVADDVADKLQYANRKIGYVAFKRDKEKKHVFTMPLEAPIGEGTETAHMVFSLSPTDGEPSFMNVHRTNGQNFILDVDTLDLLRATVIKVIKQVRRKDLSFFKE